MTATSAAPLLLLVITLHALPGSAGEDAGNSNLKVNVDCDMKPDPSDRFSEKGDLVIRSGDTVEDAMALDGDVIIKKGARVTGNAISFGGSVIAEPGAIIEQSAISVGGKLEISSAAKVNGSRVALGDTLKLRGEDGDGLQLSLNIDGENLGQKVVDDILRDLRGCREKRRADAGR